MAKTSGEETEATKALKIQTWVLKVPIHCQGCKRKVKKVLQAIDGVYTTTVDSQQQRATVTGNVGVQTLIKKLIKIGKHAEIWPEKLATKQQEEEKAGKAKNKHMPKDHPKAKSPQNDTVRFSWKGLGPSQGTENKGKSPENSTSGKNFPNKGSQGEGDGGKSGGKKTKNKGQNGNNGNCSLSLSLGSGSMPLGSDGGSRCQARGVDMGHVVGQSNLNPPGQHSIQSPQGYYHPAMYASSHSIAGPSGIPGSLHYYNVPPPYAHATSAHQTTPLESLDIFSDENVNGCSIM